MALTTPAHLYLGAVTPPPPGSVPSPGPKGKETGSRRKHWGDPSVLASLFPAVSGFPGLNGRKLWDGTPHPEKLAEVNRAGEGSLLHLAPTVARQREPKRLWLGSMQLERLCFEVKKDFAEGKVNSKDSRMSE